MTDHVFVDGTSISEMLNYDNNGKYPIVVLGGCHSTQFNVTMMNILSGIKEYGIQGYFFKTPFRFYYYEWVPRDMSSMLVLRKDGGAIAVIGNTGLGYGYTNEGATQDLVVGLNQDSLENTQNLE